MEIKRDDDGIETLGGIWDYRDDDEGIYFDIANSDEERIEKFIKNEQFIFDEMMEKSFKRTEMFGSNIEPIHLKK